MEAQHQHVQLTNRMNFGGSIKRFEVIKWVVWTWGTRGYDASIMISPLNWPFAKLIVLHVWTNMINPNIPFVARLAKPSRRWPWLSSLAPVLCCSFLANPWHIHSRMGHNSPFVAGKKT